MKKYTKEEARRTVLSCAKLYHEKLLDKKLLIIYRDSRSDKLLHLEVLFFQRNYQHLIGLELIDDLGEVIENHSEDFFRRCINNKLSLNQFRFKPDGTTHLKLAALPSLMRINTMTKMTGEYNKSKAYLFVDKVLGGVKFCLGIKYDDDSGYFVPSSALLEDIKKLTDRPSQVIAIFSKDNTDEKLLYDKVCHVAKGVNLSNLEFPT